MRVSVVIDEETLKEVMTLTGKTRKSPAPAKAIVEFTYRRRAKDFGHGAREAGGTPGLDCMHISHESACMGQVTIRRLDEVLVKKAKAEAKRRGVSMNEVLRESLLRGLGLAQERPRKPNLDKYAGDSDFGPEWEDFLEKDLKRIDEELWT